MYTNLKETNHLFVIFTKDLNNVVLDISTRNITKLPSVNHDGYEEFIEHLKKTFYYTEPFYELGTYAINDYGKIKVHFSIWNQNGIFFPTNKGLQFYPIYQLFQHVGLINDSIKKTIDLCHGFIKRLNTIEIKSIYN